MPKFEPQFNITARIAGALMRIEAAKQAIVHLPMTPSVLASLRETARLYSTHYSTMIEGNRLTQIQVAKVVAKREQFPGHERDEREVLGYYAAIQKVETLAAKHEPLTESHIKVLHAIVMSGGNRRVKPTPFRNGQNVIRDARDGAIVYMPPEAKDVPALMKQLVGWVNKSSDGGLPCPLVAGIAHYQLATIHPYYDGNGRTARLAATLIMHLGGYDLKGLYSLEEYYARNLGAYYQALTVGPSHNYYEGRSGSDITRWVDYFCQGVAQSFEKVRQLAQREADLGGGDKTAQLRKLDPRQRKVLELFRQSRVITSRDVEAALMISQRMARNFLTQWVSEGFVQVLDPAKKSRKYGLALEYETLVR